MNGSLTFGFIRLVCKDSCRSLTLSNQIHGINYGVCTNFKLKNKKKKRLDLVELNMSETDDSSILSSCLQK